MTTPAAPTWRPFENGCSVGKKGPEGGRIVIDEEHDFGARITLERKGKIAPWSVVCGIYGGFLHTAFASSEEEGRTKYEAIRRELSVILDEPSPDPDLRFDRMRHIADTY